MSAFLALLALAALQADGPPPGEGPRGTSDSHRYDEVVRAGVAEGADGAGVTVQTARVPAGRYVELTALDTGRTIAATVAAPGEGASGGVLLSPAAARLLGGGSSIALRIRETSVPPQDQVALREGRAASPRMDAPAALLVALRHRLPSAEVAAVKPAPPVAKPLPAKPPATKPAHAHEAAGASYPAPGAASSEPKPAPVKPSAKPAPPPARPSEATTGSYFVQVAALGNEARARALLAQLGGGRIVPGGGLFRVQIGPVSSTAAAQRKRDDAAKRGYGGGRIVPAR